jgi:signal transduction histidine kinase
MYFISEQHLRDRAFNPGFVSTIDDERDATHCLKIAFDWPSVATAAAVRLESESMTTSTAAPLVNLLGFTIGFVLYVMLLWMVLTYRSGPNRLALMTGMLGLTWNIGAFTGYGPFNLGFDQPSPLALAVAYGALIFLPAVVVHSALNTVETIGRLKNRGMIAAGYAMSGIATAMNFYSALVSNIVPSQLALRGVTIGFGALILVLLMVTRGQRGRGRLFWVVAMSVFAVSALHLSNHEGIDPWWLQLMGHHASLPLALVILYQDFRFALADIFLKRALAFTLLAGLVFAVFVGGVTPLLSHGELSPQSIALLLAMWVSTALVYPFLKRAAEWFVDKIVLNRTDYTHLRTVLSKAIDRCATPDAILDSATTILAPALSAESIQWQESNETSRSLWVQQDRRSARVLVPTAEAPHYVLLIRDLSGGRRLLSDDIGMLERAALLIARGIDAIRSAEERYLHDIHEQEMRKLAAEAELRALRAQVNPHFLFNALTTIGYLIQTSPERALETLMRLSGLLRGVLRSGEEFVTIGEELDLIEAYLDIERARFEDRLRVFIDVPWELRQLRIPALVIQPLVENAIKHGISECLAGGEVRISARLQEDAVLISVMDTGVGATDAVFQRRKARGVGLSNVEQRLLRYGSGPTPLVLQSAPGEGTTVEVRVPLRPTESTAAVSSARSS